MAAIPTNGNKAIYAHWIASENAFCTMANTEGGRDWMEPRELSDDELRPEGKKDDKAVETLLLTTDDMIVNAKIPPKHRKKETRDVTIAKYCIIRACECS